MMQDNAHLNDDAKSKKDVANLEPTHDEVYDIVDALDVEEEHANNIVIALVQSCETVLEISFARPRKGSAHWTRE